MARTLNRAVFTGGKLYDAGTAEADVKGDVPDEFWDGSSPGSGSVDKEPTVKEILDEVGDNKEKAAVVLEQEKSGKNRKTLVEPLEALLDRDGEES